MIRISQSPAHAGARKMGVQARPLKRHDGDVIQVQNAGRALRERTAYIPADDG
jgi:hypothetical protein